MRLKYLRHSDKLRRFFCCYTPHMTHAPVPELPHDAPKSGEVYQHYKGDRYRVVGVALNAEDSWAVVYEALYEGAAASLFVRDLAQWSQVVEWEGNTLPRFSKIS